MATYGHLSTSAASQSHKSKKCCGFSARFIHYVLFIFNFIFFISGLLILLLTLLYGTQYLELGETRLNDIRLVIPQTQLVNLIHYSMVVCGIAICSIALINSCFTCCNSYDDEEDDDHLREIHDPPLMTSTRLPSSSLESHSREPKKKVSSLPLCFFIFALLFLFTLQLIIGMIAFIHVSPNADGKDEFSISLSENLNVIEILNDNHDKFDDLQQHFKCCGWNDYEDYEQKNKSIPVPDSCCKTIVSGCGARKHPSNINYDGCLDRFGPILKEYIIILGSVAFGFSIIEIFGLIFSCCLYVQLASKR